MIEYLTFFRTTEYSGEGKYGRCAEIKHDLSECVKNAYNAEVECEDIMRDFDECFKRTKQRKALETIENAMKAAESAAKKTKKQNQ